MNVTESEFRAMFDQHYDSILAYTIRRTSSFSDAEEVASQTFVVAWNKRQKTPSDSTERQMWLYGIARQSLKNQNRGVARSTRLAIKMSRYVQKSDPDPFQNEVYEIELAIRALEHLSEVDREIIQLAVWEELRISDIGKVLGVSTPTISVRLHRAKKRLKKMFISLQDGGLAGHVGVDESSILKERQA